jgi:hypothetical protein
VTGRTKFYGSGAEWAAHLAADVWTATATAARHGIEPLRLLTGYLQECARDGGPAPAAAGLSPFLPWTPQDAPAVVPPAIPVPARNPAILQPRHASPWLSVTCRPQGTTRSGSRSCRRMTQATAQLGEIIDLMRVPCRTSAAYCRARTPNWSMASAVRCMRCSSTGPTGKSGSAMTAVTSRGS